MSRYYNVANGSTLKINNIEKFDNVADFEYKGCWKDTTDRAIPMYLEGVTPENCMSEAIKKGYNTYGLQNGNQCFIGNNPDYAKHGRAENCDKFGNQWKNQVYQKPSSMNVNEMNVINTLCFNTNGVKQCINGDSLAKMYKDIDSLNQTIPSNNLININRMNKIEESQTSFSNSIQEQLKTLKESNEQQNSAVRKALSEQYELLRTSIEGQGATFKTKLDELNKDVYDMKSRIGQPATTTVVSQPIGPNATVPQQPIMVESPQQTGMAGPTPQQPVMPQSTQPVMPQSTQPVMPQSTQQPTILWG